MSRLPELLTMKLVSTEVLRVTPLRSQPSTRAWDHKIVSSRALVSSKVSSILSSNELYTHLRAAAGRVADELSLAAHLDVGGVRWSLEIFPQR